MEIYTPKTKIKLSPVIRNGREFVEVTFGNDNDIRLSLSKEENVLLVGGRAYLPAEDFVLAEFFDRYVKMAFIDYSGLSGSSTVGSSTPITLLNDILRSVSSGTNCVSVDTEPSVMLAFCKAA